MPVAHAGSMARRAVAELAEATRSCRGALAGCRGRAADQGPAWRWTMTRPTCSSRLALAPWWLGRGRWVQGYARLQRAAGQADEADSAWYAVRSGWAGSPAECLISSASSMATTARR